MARALHGRAGEVARMGDWTIRIGLLTVFALGACATEVGSPSDEAEDERAAEDSSAPSLVERLEEGADFELRPELTRVIIDARAADRAPEETSQLDLPLREGHFALRGEPEGGRLVLEELAVDLEDVRISSEVLPPDGVQLTDVRVHTAEPFEGRVEWSSAGEAYAEIEVDLLLDWAFVGTEGNALPLSQQQIRTVLVSFDLHEARDGIVHAELIGALPGTLRRWSGLGEISNLRFDVRAVESLPAVQ